MIFTKIPTLHLIYTVIGGKPKTTDYGGLGAFNKLRSIRNINLRLYILAYSFQTFPPQHGSLKSPYGKKNTGKQSKTFQHSHQIVVPSYVAQTKPLIFTSRPQHNWTIPKFISTSQNSIPNMMLALSIDPFRSWKEWTEWQINWNRQKHLEYIVYFIFLFKKDTTDFNLPMVNKESSFVRVLENRVIITHQEPQADLPILD